MKTTKFDIENAELTLIEGVCPGMFSELIDTIKWEQRQLKMWGKLIDQPRLTALYGDKSYSYSGTTFNAHPWTATLTAIKNKVEELCQIQTNAVLCNLYRDGNDYVGWHADDEHEMGTNPVIASVSIGAERRFQIRNNVTKAIDFMLPDGSVLVMAGEMQSHWQHRLPKALKVKEPRINLTFRSIK